MLQQTGQLVIMHSNRLEKLRLKFSYKILKYFKKLSQPIRVIFKTIFQNQTQYVLLFPYYIDKTYVLLFPYYIDKTQLFILENQKVLAKKRREPPLNTMGFMSEQHQRGFSLSYIFSRKVGLWGVCVCLYVFSANIK